MGNSQNSVIVVNNLNEAPAALAAVTHAGLDDIANDEVTLVLRVIDETGSMQRFQNEVELADREMIAALKNSKASDQILMSTWLFNTSFKVLHGFVPLDDVLPLAGIYRPDDQTALYSAVYSALTDANAGVVSYADTLSGSGIRVKVVVVVFTDGEDNYSDRLGVWPAQIKTVVSDLLKLENFLFSLVAFGTGFARTAASEMGFPNILESNSQPGEIRRAMGTVSKSIIRASQTTVRSNNFFS